MNDFLQETLTDPQYFEFLFEKIKQLRQQPHLCDIQILAKYDDNTQVRYPAHKIFLAAGSPYFAAHIGESEKKKCNGELKTHALDLDLRNNKSEDFPKILDYLYTGEVRCTITNVISLFKYSEKFEMESLKFVLTEFMKNNVTSYTWLQFWRFSETQNYHELAEKCTHFCRVNLEDSINKNLEKLKSAELIKIVNGCKVNSEKERFKVFKCIIKWIEINEEERLQHLFPLTEWNSVLMISAIVNLYNNQRTKLKDFLTKLTFNKLQNLCSSETNFDTQIKYVCIKEWVKLFDREPYEKFLKLLKLIDLRKIDKDFFKMEMSVEKLICENPNIETYVKLGSEILLEYPNQSLKLILLTASPEKFMEIVKSFSMISQYNRLTVFKYIKDWIGDHYYRRLYYFTLIEWNPYLLVTVLVDMQSFHWLRPEKKNFFEYFLSKMTFNQMVVCCGIRDIEICPKVLAKALYICIREWIYLHEKPCRSSRAQELLLLLDWKHLTKEFIEYELSTNNFLRINMPGVKLLEEIYP